MTVTPTLTTIDLPDFGMPQRMPELPDAVLAPFLIEPDLALTIRH